MSQGGSKAGARSPEWRYFHPPQNSGVRLTFPFFFSTRPSFEKRLSELPQKDETPFAGVLPLNLIATRRPWLRRLPYDQLRLETDFDTVGRGLVARATFAQNARQDLRETSAPSRSGVGGPWSGAGW